MKKAFSLLLAALLCVGLCACGGEAPATEAPANEAPVTEATAAPTTEATEPQPVIYNLGDVIETDLFRITPSFTGYAYKLSNWPDENYMTPAGKESGDSPYNADEGKTEIYGEILIEYIGNEKEDVTISWGISVNYDDGYIFEGDDVDSGYCVSLNDSWKYDAYATFEPLSDATTRIVRYCVEVPAQVEENKDKSLLVTFYLNGEPYIYDFRSAEVRGSDYDPRAEFYQPIDEELKAQIVAYLKKNGLVEVGWYDKTVGYYTFTFGDSTVEAILPINNSYQYEFSGTYEVYSGSILISWDFGKQMHLDYTFDGTTLDILAFEHDR